MGDPNIVPKLVGSLILGTQNKVPLIFGNSHIYIYISCLKKAPSSFYIPADPG